MCYHELIKGHQGSERGGRGGASEVEGERVGKEEEERQVG